MRSKGVADDTLVAADMSLDQSASIVSAGVSWQRPLVVEERSLGHPDVVPRQLHIDRRYNKLYKFPFDLTDGGNWLVDVHASS